MFSNNLGRIWERKIFSMIFVSFPTSGSGPAKNFYIQILKRLVLRWSSHCYPSEKAGRQDFTYMIALPSIKKDIKSRKQREEHGMLCTSVGGWVHPWGPCAVWRCTCWRYRRSGAAAQAPGLESTAYKEPNILETFLWKLREATKKLFFKFPCHKGLMGGKAFFLHP